MSWLKFFEARDAELGESDTAPEPLLGHDGVMHYEISVFVMLVHTKKCVNFGWSGRGKTSRRTVEYLGNPSCRMYLPWCGPLNRIRPTSHLELPHQNGRRWCPGLCRSAGRGKSRCLTLVGFGLRRLHRDGQTQEQGTVTTAKVSGSFR